MQEALGYLFAYGIPTGIALAGMLSITIGFALVLTMQRPLLLGFIACLVLIAASSTYGLEDVTESNVFWVKGSKTFYFTFIEMGLWGAWLAMLFRNAWQQPRPVAGAAPREPWLPMTKYYVGLALLLLGHVLAGLPQDHRHVLLDLSLRGFTGVLYQGILISLVVSVLRTERDLRLVMWILLLGLAGRHLFGLVRYAAFGGDPQNAYAVLGSSKVKITFWDINDSVFAATMFALCAWRLLNEKIVAIWELVFLPLAALMALLIPMLSARRTGQAGMLLAMALLAALLPPKRRLFAVAAIVLSVPLVLGALARRADDSHASLAQRVLIDIKTDPLADPRRSRFHELATAWDSIKENPVFGLGPSGRYKVLDNTGLEYHGGNFDFVHSGFGHVVLKAGFVGLALFVGALLAWAAWLRRHWGALQGQPKALAVAAVCGWVSLLPTLLFGTPIPEIRTMLGMGFLMALPIVAVRVCRQAAAAAAEPAAAPAAAAWWPGRPARTG